MVSPIILGRALTPGEQLVRFQEMEFPRPFGITTPLETVGKVLGSPRTTVVLATALGGLLGFRGAGASGILKGVAKGFGFGTAGTVAPSVITTFPEVTKLFFDPTKRIEEIEEIPEAPGKIKEFFGEKVKKVKETISDIPSGFIPTIAGIGIGAAALPIIKTIVEKVQDRREETILEQQQVSPTLFADIPAIPTPIGAVEVPVEPIAPQVRQPDINISVKPSINVRPAKNEVFINNIMQSI